MHLIARFSRGELIRAIGDAVHLYQDATDAFDDAACAALGLNRTDLKCLNVIAQLRLERSAKWLV
jgi:hypothetical protein